MLTRCHLLALTRVPGAVGGHQSVRWANALMRVAERLQRTADRDGRGAPEVDDLTVLIGGIGAQKYL
jgi:hypothetical protein